MDAVRAQRWPTPASSSPPVRIGDVLLVQADFCGPARLRPAERALDLALGGGSGPGPRRLPDLVRPALPRPAGRGDGHRHDVRERSRRLGRDPPRYADGRAASLTCSLAAASPVRAVVVGTGGSIELEPPFNHASRIVVRRNGAEAEVVERLATGRGYTHQAEEVQRCLAAGLTESPVMPLRRHPRRAVGGGGGARAARDRDGRGRVEGGGLAARCATRWPGRCPSPSAHPPQRAREGVGVDDAELQPHAAGADSTAWSATRPPRPSGGRRRRRPRGRGCRPGWGSPARRAPRVHPARRTSGARARPACRAAGAAWRWCTPCATGRRTGRPRPRSVPRRASGRRWRGPASLHRATVSRGTSWPSRRLLPTEVEAPHTSHRGKQGERESRGQVTGMEGVEGGDVHQDEDRAPRGDQRPGHDGEDEQGHVRALSARETHETAEQTEESTHQQEGHDPAVGDGQPVDHGAGPRRRRVGADRARPPRPGASPHRAGGRPDPGRRGRRARSATRRSRSARACSERSR